MNKLQLLNKELNTNYKSLKDAYKEVNWHNISINQQLSEEFIEKFGDKVNWNYISVYQKLSEEFIEKFGDKLNWDYISEYQKLSEEFIDKFKYKVYWDKISINQQLSEEFIEKFQYKFNWYYISKYQPLSEEFIEKFGDKVNWYYISKYQQLSEEFIEKFKDKVDWYYISINQKLSKEFIKKFKDKVHKELQLKSHYDKRTEEEKRKEMTDYAKEHNLKFEDDFLYCFRNHDNFGRGAFNKTIIYEKGKYYQDWRCDLNTENENSFGLGAWTAGNTPIRIHIKDWGISLDKNHNFKIRCFGFEII